MAKDIAMALSDLTNDPEEIDRIFEEEYLKQDY